MRLIKLNATDSTNDFLKQLVANQPLENFTVVIANHQLKGRGQMGAEWNSEPGKNLTFSVLLNDVLENIESIYNLNVAVAVSIIEVLTAEHIYDLKIKWPNDIMSANKKIGGILIENLIKNASNLQSIVGVGLNVNQKDFNHLPQASSLYLITKKVYDCEDLLLKIVDCLASNVKLIKQNQSGILWNKYHQLLYKKGIPSAFESAEGVQFMGIIQKVIANGQLEVLLVDDSLAYYSVKEVKMLY